MGAADSPSGMFEVLDATEGDFIAVRVGSGSPAGYERFYSLLVERTDQYGLIRVYEEVPNWAFRTYLTHLHGIVPDLKYGPDFNIIDHSNRDALRIQYSPQEFAQLEGFVQGVSALPLYDYVRFQIGVPMSVSSGCRCLGRTRAGRGGRPTSVRRERAGVLAS